MKYCGLAKACMILAGPPYPVTKFPNNRKICKEGLKKYPDILKAATLIKASYS